MIRFYNSLTRQKEELVVKDNLVKMYSCGPTVYYYPHIGNFRAYVFMDLIKRTLLYNGYKVKNVMNITDVGHLTSDEDTGDDKMLVASKKENKTPWEIAEFYTNYFFKDAEKLNILKPTIIAKATEHINEMIEFVKGLLEKGYAYELDDGIYFDVQKFKDYGKLSRVNLEDKKAGARIEVNEKKHHPADFALWIKAPKEHIMKWESPWGLGYPGWHIECSAMGRKYLGTHFQIHTGGIDHLTVHHENEIAQNDALNGSPVVEKWMHVEFLQVNGGKMGKSLNNLYRIEDLEEKGYSALDYRYFLLNTHYRKTINFTFDAIESSKTALNRLISVLYNHKNGKAKIEESKLKEYKQKFLNAINDDLNLPLAVGIVWDIVKNNEYSVDIYNLIIDFDKVLGLSLENSVKEYKDISFTEIEVPQEIKDLAEKRLQAKKEKNYVLADNLRNEITQKGYNLIDTPQGYKINKI